MRYRPPMKDVVVRLQGCIDELTLTPQQLQQQKKGRDPPRDQTRCNKRLIDECWDYDMRYRPPMKDVVVRLQGCIDGMLGLRYEISPSHERCGGTIAGVY